METTDVVVRGRRRGTLQSLPRVSERFTKARIDSVGTALRLVEAALVARTRGVTTAAVRRTASRASLRRPITSLGGSFFFVVP